MSNMTDLEAMDLSPEQIEQRYAKAIGGEAALMKLYSDMLPILDKLQEAIENELEDLMTPPHIRIWRAILDALDFIRRLLRAIYHNSGEMVDPDNYGYKGPVSTNHH